MRAIQWKCQINDVIVDFDDTGNIVRNMVIIDKRVITKKHINRHNKNPIQNHNQKYYKYQCKICGYSGWIEEGHLLRRKQKCSCCAGKAVQQGYNDVATTHPHLIQYFANQQDAKTHSANSDFEPTLICPLCGHIKNGIKIDTLNRYGFSCSMCSDHVSYAEKFMQSFFDQLGVEYIYQFSKKHAHWCMQYKYDFYFNLNNIAYIVETHGVQHYEARWDSTINIKQNDQNKQQLAFQNGFTSNSYIVLNCFESNLDWIRQSIENSSLNQLFDLDNIDWNECNRATKTSLCVDICQAWAHRSNDNITVPDIANDFGVCAATVRKYLCIGTELGLCSYNGKEETRRATMLNNQKRIKQVVVLNENKNVVGIFDSCVDVQDKSKDIMGFFIHKSAVSKACRKSSHYFKGYYFYYDNDYERN